MATGIDRSKYRNPDMPAGYVKPDSDLRYKIGADVDGDHLITPSLMDKNFVLKDDGTLSDWITSDENEIKIIEDDDVFIISDDEKDRPSTSHETKKIKKYSSRKKGNDSCDTSDTSRFFMDIDHQKLETKKTKLSPRKSYRHDSGSSPSRNRSSSRSYRPRKRSSSRSYRPRKRSSSRSYRPRKRSSSRNYRPTKRSAYSHSSIGIECQKYQKKTKKSERKSYRRDSSSSSSRDASPLPSYRPRNKNTYSQSPLPNVKRKSSIQPQHTNADYHCRVCNLNLNGILSYNDHLNGKRHLRNLKNKNLVQVKTQGTPFSASGISEEPSKYPKPVDGVLRKKVQTPAKIQGIIEEKVKRPCIGLNAVTEIQGFAGVQYYCSLCNIVCFSVSIIPHLTGQNHMKQSARRFHRNYKEIITVTPKPERENKILELLNELQSEHGMGKMAVEVEELEYEPPRVAFNVNRPVKGQIYSSQPDLSKDLNVQPASSRDFQNKPSTSRGTGNESSDIPFPELCNRSSSPTKIGKDIYCKVCESHMNSQQMWEAHVKGKRHHTNLRKFPGDVPSKTKTVPIPNRHSVLVGRLNIECPTEPIVGLQFIQEIEMPKLKTYTYKCFLCGACPCDIDIIEHLISLKHRIKYLNHIKFPNVEIAYNMGEETAYELVSEMCNQVEAQEGRGKPRVHLLKNLLFVV